MGRIIPYIFGKQKMFEPPTSRLPQFSFSITPIWQIAAVFMVYTWICLKNSQKKTKTTYRFPRVVADVPLVKKSQIIDIDSTKTYFPLYGGRFPKMVVAPNHQFFTGFSIINHPIWGTPISGNLYMGVPYFPFPSFPHYIPFSKCRRMGQFKQNRLLRGVYNF